MYPYRRRTRWILSNRYQHLIKALERHLPDDELEAHPTIARRVKAMKGLLRVRLTLFALLYMDIIAAVASILLVRLPEAERAVHLLEALATVTSTLAFLFAGGILLVGRFLGQNEMDVLTYLILEENPVQS